MLDIYQAQNEEMHEVLVGNDTMSIKLHLQQMEEIESRLREISNFTFSVTYHVLMYVYLYKEHHTSMEENDQLKKVVGMYKLTCRELRLKVGQSMAELIKH